MDTTFVYFSDDEGKTWKASKTEVVIWHKDGLGGMWPCDEPGRLRPLAQLKDKLLMFMRTTLGRIYATTSKDGGENWQMPQPTDLAMSYSPCRLRRIPTSGDLLCVWNLEPTICRGNPPWLSSGPSQPGNFHRRR